jgi:outer membrane protein OmpA-like peptidoglycan-associated protein
MKVTTQLQVFALAVTAEPYFAVRKPSTKLVLLNEPRDKVKGKLFLLDAQFDLLEWSQYKKLSNPLGMSVDLKQFPLDLYEARNAIHIAQMLESEKYAGDILEKAKQSLKMAEDAAANKKSRKEISTNARQAVQFSEDARALSLKRQDEEAHAAQLAREAQAKADAQRAERARQAEAARRAQAEQDRLKAELAAAQEQQRRAEAEAARARAQAEQERANKAAAEAARAAEQANREARLAREAEEAARQSAAKSAREKAELRAKLLQQFNAILETKDTERGLVVNMGDVLFDSGRYTLRPLAREKLARLSGIVLAYPELSLQSEGHTDNVGGEAFNQKLSEQRASAVRDYLVSQGIPAEKVTSVGKGFSMPVEDNKTAAGRQKNRRVELIVSGEVIGAKIETIK